MVKKILVSMVGIIECSLFVYCKQSQLGFSKEADVLEAHVILEIAYLNLVRHHGGLTVTEEKSDSSKVKVRRTPAMAAGLADAPWTFLDLLTYKVSPLNPLEEEDSMAA